MTFFSVFSAEIKNRVKRGRQNVLEKFWNLFGKMVYVPF